MNTELPLKQSVVRNSDLSFTEVDGETVVMNVVTGSYYGMNEIGTRIWEFLETPLSIGDLCNKLTEEYDADLETVQGDLLPYLGELEREQLIIKV
mgnify:CR=1 FL=1